MGRSISNSLPLQRNTSPFRQSESIDLHRTSDWPSKHDSGCTLPTFIDRGLYDQSGPVDENISSIRLSSFLGHFHPQNDQFFKQNFYCTPIGLISKVIQKLIRDNAAAVLILPRCPDSRQIYERRTETTIRNNRADKDKHKDGESLYIQLDASTNLIQVAIDTLIADQNPETWRKKRARHTLLIQYIKEKDISVKDLLGIKPDIELVNALSWYKSRGGPKIQNRIKNMKMHCGVVLSQFSQINDMNNFPIIKTFSKDEGLQTQSKPRYTTIWNLQILFNYINANLPLISEEIQQTATTMIVAFCAARKTELAKMKVSKIEQELHSITLQTRTSKGKQIIKHTITFRKRIGRCCPVKTFLLRTTQIGQDSIMHDQIWYNLSKKAPATPQYCSHQLTAFIRRADIQSPYTGPTICRLTMTRLKAAGATQPKVNAFTRYAISSNV
ncbi:MAG: hypothetical protein EZS28_037199, partial [Streblomastix strix]